MADLGLEKSLELRQTAEDTFQNLHEPWTWRGGVVVPGSLLMAEAAVAAYKTVDEGYAIDTIQAQFLAQPNPKKVLSYAVKRLRTGERFAVRHVVASQDERNVFAVTVTFVTGAAKSTPAMTHAVDRETPYTIDCITLDDLEGDGSPGLGPWMKFQRLAVHHPDPRCRNPQTATAVCAAHVAPAIARPQGHAFHIVGIISLSDHHVLDAPLQLSDITFGLPTIEEPNKRTKNHLRMTTSLNHTIHFHKHDGFRADDMCYIEAKSPWAGEGRALIQTRIFSGKGTLIASCVQEAYYILTDDASVSKL